MIRFALAAGIAAILLGVVGWSQLRLTRHLDVSFARHEHEPGGEVSLEAGGFDLVLTPGFDAVRDPFALDGAEDSERLVVRAGEREVVRYRDDLRRGQPVRVPDQPFALGPLELFVEAVPAPADAAWPCPLRVQIKQGETLMAETTLWSAGEGSRIAERIQLELTPHRRTLDRGLRSGGA